MEIEGVSQERLDEILTLTTDIVNGCKLVFGGIIAREHAHDTDTEVIANALVNAACSMALAALSFTEASGCDTETLEKVRDIMAKVILTSGEGHTDVH